MLVFLTTMSAIEMFRPDKNYKKSFKAFSNKKKSKKNNADMDAFMEDYFALNSVDSYQKQSHENEENQDELVCNHILSSQLNIPI